MKVHQLRRVVDLCRINRSFYPAIQSLIAGLLTVGVRNFLLMSATEDTTKTLVTFVKAW